MRTMTWSETHRRWAVLREVLEALETHPDGGLPWRDEYADVFGDREGLLTALRYRWQLIARAQYDPDLPEPVLEAHWRDLTARHAGLLRVLRRFPAVATAGDDSGEWLVRAS
ncbi:hypothetical protein [Nocardioides sp.]|uniref:hypothetical protein n=1 Tax=Nocardioides sp. TaxID=35761 RepID=UPI002736ADEB|nr:hypothetical protein [Nocardioides sp.]MDP3891868.1 hypothetical protein [Nocardioides sp.]